MIDIDLFRKILEEDGYIECGDIIPIELFELMCSSPIDKVKSLFKKHECILAEKKLYTVNIKCTECGKIFSLKVCKTNLLNLISLFKNKSKKNYKCLCIECHSKELEIEKERKKAKDIERELNIIKNTESYISSYLDPNKCWNKDVPYYVKFRQIKDVPVNWNAIKEHIRNMNYYDFFRNALLEGYFRKSQEQGKI